MMAAAAAAKLTTGGILSVASSPHRRKPQFLSVHHWPVAAGGKKSLRILCKATEVSVAGESSSAGSSGGRNWVPVVPLAALPKGERRVIIQDGETILLLWYKDEVFAIENRSPAEGAYSEGLLNAKLTRDGYIVCPTTDSTFDLRTGPSKNGIQRILS